MDKLLLEAIDASAAIEKLKEAQLPYQGISGIFKLYDRILMDTNIYDKFVVLRDKYYKNLIKIQKSEFDSSKKRETVKAHNNIAILELMALLGETVEKYSEKELAPLRGRKDVTNKLDFDLFIPVAVEFERLQAKNLEKFRKQLFDQAGGDDDKNLGSPSALTMADRQQARETQILNVIKDLVNRKILPEKLLGANHTEREAAVQKLNEKFMTDSESLYKQINDFLNNKAEEPQNWSKIRDIIFKHFVEQDTLNNDVIKAAQSEEEKNTLVKTALQKLNTRKKVVNLGIIEEPSSDAGKKNISSLENFLTSDEAWNEFLVGDDNTIQSRPINNYKRSETFSKLFKEFMVFIDDAKYSEKVINYLALLFDGTSIPILFKGNKIASRFADKKLNLRDGKLDDESQNLIDEFLENFAIIQSQVQDKLLKQLYSKLSEIWNNNPDNHQQISKVFDKYFQSQGQAGNIANKIGIKYGDPAIELSKQIEAGTLPPSMGHMSETEQMEFIRTVLADKEHPYYSVINRSFGPILKKSSFSDQAKTLIWGEGFPLPAESASIPKKAIEALIAHDVDEGRARSMTKNEAIQALRDKGVDEETIRSYFPSKEVPEDDHYVGEYLKKFLIRKHQSKRQGKGNEQYTWEQIMTLDNPWAYVGYRVTNAPPGWVRGSKQQSEGDALPSDIYIPFWTRDGDNGRRDADKLMLQLLQDGDQGYEMKYSAVTEIPYDIALQRRMTKGRPGSILYKPLSKKKARATDAAEIDIPLQKISGISDSGNDRSAGQPLKSIDAMSRELGITGARKNAKPVPGEEEDRHSPAAIKQVTGVPETQDYGPAGDVKSSTNDLPIVEPGNTNSVITRDDILGPGTKSVLKAKPKPSPKPSPETKPLALDTPEYPEDEPGGTTSSGTRRRRYEG